MTQVGNNNGKERDEDVDAVRTVSTLAIFLGSVTRISLPIKWRNKIRSGVKAEVKFFNQTVGKNRTAIIWDRKAKDGAHRGGVGKVNFNHRGKKNGSAHPPRCL